MRLRTSWLWFWLSITLGAGAFRFLGSTTLGPDPQTVNRLNGESFQQDALVTLNGMFDPFSCALSFPASA